MLQFEARLWMLIFRFIMKFLMVLPAFLAVGFAQVCFNDVRKGCSEGIVSITQLSDRVPLPFVWSYH
jgi:hypothetical protein